jgi:hypothetical protein
MSVTAIITWILGIVGVGGLGAAMVWAVSIMGVPAALLLAKKIPWKLVVGVLAALAITGAIFAGYHYVSGLNDKLAAAKAELATEQHLHALAKLRGDYLEQAHNASVAKVQQLEVARAAAAADAQTMREQILNLDIEKDFSDEKDTTLPRLNGANVRLNRMLESVSAGHAAGAGRAAAGSPGQTSPPATP